MNPPIAVAKEHRWVGALLAGERLDLEGEALARFAGWLERHRLAAYVHHIAAEQAPKLAPLLLAARQAELARTLLKEAWMEPLLRDLETAGVDTILFKGLGIAYLKYPLPELRPLGDLDLFVGNSGVIAAISAARRLSFEVSADPMVLRYHVEEGYNVPLVHPRHGTLELHHALYRDCPDALVAEVVARSVRADVLGVTVRVFRDEDLWLVLATHFCVSAPGSRWLWLFDLVLLGRSLTRENWSAIADVALLHGQQVFVVAVLNLLRALWGVKFEAAPDLASMLSERERAALGPMTCLLVDEPFDGEKLSIARRLSGRPVRGRLGRLRWLWSHPGAVCLELGVAYEPRKFVWYRLRHVARRASRALRGLGYASRPLVRK